MTAKIEPALSAGEWARDGITWDANSRSWAIFKQIADALESYLPQETT